MQKGRVSASVGLMLAFAAELVLANVPVWLARDPPWPCAFGFPVQQYGASFSDAFENLFNFKVERCFIGCANRPFPPPAPSCRYLYRFERLLSSNECSAPGTCFRYRYFDTQNPPAGWKRADSYFRISHVTARSCPDGSNVTTDDNAQLACAVPARPWDEDKNLGLGCAGHALAGNPVNLATGNKLHAETDIGDVASRLVLRRVYNSLFKDDTGLGTGWTTNWHRRLELGAFELTVRDGDGRGEHWSYNYASQSWSGDSDSRIRLAQVNDRFIVTREDETTETYHFNGHLLRVDTLDGVVTTLVYDNPENPDRLLSVSSSTGESLTFTYSADAHIETVFDHAGNTWTYTYDAGGNLEYVYSPDGTADGYANNPYRRYHYNEAALIDGAADLPGHMTGISDRNGLQETRFANYEYFADGRVKASYHAGNADRLDIAYDDINQTRTLTNSRGAQSTYSITTTLGVAQVTGVTGPGCASCGTGNASYSHDAETNHLLAKTGNGMTTEYGAYDAHGNPGFKIEARGTPEERRIDYTYDPRYFSKLASVTEPSVYAGANKVTSYRYDEYGNRTEESISGFTPAGIPVTRTTRREYSGPLHQLSRVDGPRTDVSDVTRYRYYPDRSQEGNNRARLQEIENAAGVLVRSGIRYTTTGKVARENRPNGLTLVYTYYPGADRLAILAESSPEATNMTRWTYLETGEVRSITTAYGAPEATTVTFGYDDARRLVQVSDGLNNAIRYTLDTEGNRIAEQTYDGDGKLVRALHRIFDVYNRQDIGMSGNNPDSPLMLLDTDYSPEGNLERSVDGNGAITGYRYDALRRLLVATHDLGGGDAATANAVSRFGYDNAGRLNAVTDPNGGTTDYRYDDLGNLLSVSSPDTGTTLYQHDTAGNVLSMTTASGTSEAVTHFYTYDVLNRLKRVTTVDAAEDIVYTWDNCHNGRGRICRVASGGATVFYSYDDFGNVTAHQGIAYSYDAANRLRSIAYPSGAVVTYSHGTDGQVDRVDLTVNGQTQTLAGPIGHLPFGGITALHYGNGMMLEQAWDSAYRLTEQVLPGILALGYPRYDRNGNLVQREDGLIGTGSFGYDAFDRLQIASGPFGSGWRYEYDRNGNRVLGDEGEPLALHYAPASNRLDRQGTMDVMLSVAGNTLARGAWRYEYDTHQRLAAAFDNGAPVVRYVYNGLGQRVSKLRPDGSAVIYLYDTKGKLLAEADRAGNVLVEYVYLDGQPLAIYLPDSDQNGLTNREEAALGGNQADPDDDGDGLGNRDELLVRGTLINRADTDGDGVTDADEVAIGSDPGDADSIARPGDIDSDGQVSVGDYLLLVQISLGVRPPAPAEFAAGDLNHDDRISAGDLVILSQTLLTQAWQTVTDSAIGRVLLTIRSRLVDTAEAAVAQGRLYYVHNDHLGTPQAMTDEAGNVTWRANYDPFGRARLDVETVELNLRFPGQYYDQETGLHYNFFRYYDPSTGRYITSDPIGIDGGLNTYGYAQANPVRNTDPLGLWVKRCMRKLGSTENGNADQNSVFRHDYLNVSGSILSYQAGDNWWWSQGRIDYDERSDRMCPLVCGDNKFDKYVFEAANEIGAPTYCLLAYAGTYQHLLGARNCQTWVDGVLALAKEKYLNNEECPGCFK